MPSSESDLKSRRIPRREDHGIYRHPSTHPRTIVGDVPQPTEQAQQRRHGHLSAVSARLDPLGDDMSTPEPRLQPRPWTDGPWAHVTRGYFDCGSEIWGLGNEDDPIQFPVADYAAMGEPESWDRRLIELAPEMAEAILQWHGCFDEHCCDEHHSKCRCHVRLGNVANQLEEIGGDHGPA